MKPPAPPAAATATVAVAVSGGRDSTALLHATLRAAAALGVQVVALHVHHGLNPNAGAWLRHVRRQCARWRRAGAPLELHWAQLDGAVPPGQSVEAWARRERYAALSRMTREHGASLVLLAHHRRDQAETVLLQALRGAGAAGLAAMPVTFERHGVRWARPWLTHSDAAIDAYVRRWRLGHIVDDSNVDARFERNRIRQWLWPQFAAAFPRAETTLAQVAAHAARAQALIDEAAGADLAALAGADGIRRLTVARWLALSPARRWFVLRAWLAAGLPHGAPESLIDRLCAELPQCQTGCWPAGQGGELRLYRGWLVYRPANGPPARHPAADAPETIQLEIHRPGVYPLAAWGGVLEVHRARIGQASVPLTCLAGVECRPRGGGERFQTAAQTPPRSLKKQYQHLGIAAWQRRGPLLWVADQLVFVPGLGLDARAQAWTGAPRCSLEFRYSAA